MTRVAIAFRLSPMASPAVASNPKTHMSATPIGIVRKPSCRRSCGDLGKSAHGRSGLDCFHFEPHATTAGLARGALPYEFYAGNIECIHKLHQRIDVSADEAFARLHALDVGTDKLASSAKARWSSPSSARAARIWVTVIMF